MRSIDTLPEFLRKWVGWTCVGAIGRRMDGGWFGLAWYGTYHVAISMHACLQRAVGSKQRVVVEARASCSTRGSMLEQMQTKGRKKHSGATCSNMSYSIGSGVQASSYANRYVLFNHIQFIYASAFGRILQSSLLSTLRQQGSCSHMCTSPLHGPR